MKFDDIQIEWEKDRYKKGDDISQFISRVSYIHAKYFKIWREERRLVLRLQETYDNLYKDKLEYYLGRLSKEDLEAKGWKPFQVRLVKSDLEPYLNADKDLSKAKIQIAEQEDKVYYVLDAIKHINKYDYLLRTNVEYLKFINGKN